MPHLLPQTWPQFTATILVVNLVVLVLYAVAARVFGGDEATISVVISTAAHRWPMLPLAIGILIGHWFWQLYGS